MPARYEIISAWAREFRWRDGAELGVFDGRTHLYLLDRCPDLLLIGVDVWDMPGFSEGPTKSGERCFCQYCSETRASRKARSIGQMKTDVLAAVTRYRGRSDIFIGPTVEAALAITDGSLDFCLIDADHSFQGVSSDIRAWLPKIRQGGRLIGHDWNLKSVRDAASSHFRSSEILLDDDHLWYVNI